MKRLLLFTLLLVTLGGCAATTSSSGARAPVLSRSVTLDEVPLRLDVTGLHRRGAVAALDLRLVNRSPRGGQAFSIDDTFSREGSYDLGGVLLVDSSSGHELAPLENDDDLDLGFTEVSGGGTQSLRVAFPAPRGSKVDLLVPHFGLFRGVPVD
jgi:hypothetical protein